MSEPKYRILQELGAGGMGTVRKGLLLGEAGFQRPIVIKQLKTPDPDHLRLFVEEARRYAVLEVVERPAPDRYVIVSGFGARSQWYQNLLVKPQVHVSVGSRRGVPAVATPMSRDAVKAALARSAERYPRTWARIEPTLEAALQTPELDLPMVTLELAGR